MGACDVLQDGHYAGRDCTLYAGLRRDDGDQVISRKVVATLMPGRVETNVFADRRSLAETNGGMFKRMCHSVAVA